MLRKKNEPAQTRSEPVGMSTEAEDIGDDEEPTVNLGISAAGLPLNQMHPRSEKLLKGALSSGEAVICQLAGVNKSQALVLTDKRAFIIKVGWRSGQTLGGKVTSFEYRNVSSVEVRGSMMSGVFEIASGGVQGREASYYGGKDKTNAWTLPNTIPIARRQIATFQQAAQVIRERAAQAHQAPSTTAPSSPDVTEQIRKLGELHDSGVLTDVEFTQKKADLLARI